MVDAVKSDRSRGLPVNEVVVEVSGDDPDSLEPVFVLHRAAKARLGPMPDQGFSDRAAAGTLLVARIDDEVVGYVLFDLPGDRVKIVHLCTAPTRRRRGIGRALVDEIRRRHGQRRGIALRCRRDFRDSIAAWNALGFSPRGDRPGRSAAGHAVTDLFLDFGHATLFSQPEPGRALAAMDQMIHEDLVSERDEGADSRRLLDDWLQEHIELCVSDQVRIESHKCEDPELRARLLNACDGLRAVASGQRLPSDLVRRIGEFAPRAGISDHRHVAFAITGGVTYFLSRDEKLLEGREAIEKEYRLIMLRPEELQATIDRAVQSDGYEPVALRGTHLSRASLAPTGQDKFVKALLNNADGERASRLRPLVRAALADPANQRVEVVQEPTGAVVAGAVVKTTGRVREVAVLRVSRGDRQAAALARQHVATQRIAAAEARLDRVRVVDPSIGPLVRRALLAESFQLDDDGGWTCNLGRGFVSANAAGVASSHDAAALERDRWPLKIVGSGLATYRVPIEPAFAEDLFDVRLATASIFPRDRLALGREHVYYRSPAQQPNLRGPARILWYVKQGAGGWPGGICAVSHLTEVVVDRPRTLFRRYERLGVWSRTKVEQSAHRGKVQALRVSDTEVFSNPLHLADIRKMHFELGARLNLQGVQPVPEQVFRRIYERCSPYGS